MQTVPVIRSAGVLLLSSTVTRTSRSAGYAARRKIDGRPRGPSLRARTLDELAALIEAQK